MFFLYAHVLGCNCIFIHVFRICVLALVFFITKLLYTLLHDSWSHHPLCLSLPHPSSLVGINLYFSSLEAVMELGDFGWIRGPSGALVL